MRRRGVRRRSAMAGNGGSASGGGPPTMERETSSGTVCRLAGRYGSPRCAVSATSGVVCKHASASVAAIGWFPGGPGGNKSSSGHYTARQQGSARICLAVSSSIARGAADHPTAGGEWRIGDSRAATAHHAQASRSCATGVVRFVPIGGKWPRRRTVCRHRLGEALRATACAGDVPAHDGVLRPSAGVRLVQYSRRELACQSAPGLQEQRDTITPVQDVCRYQFPPTSARRGARGEAGEGTWVLCAGCCSPGGRATVRFALVGGVCAVGSCSACCTLGVRRDRWRRTCRLLPLGQVVTSCGERIAFWPIAGPMAQRCPDLAAVDRILSRSRQSCLSVRRLRPMAPRTVSAV